MRLHPEQKKRKHAVWDSRYSVARLTQPTEAVIASEWIVALQSPECDTLVEKTSNLKALGFGSAKYGISPVQFRHFRRWDAVLAVNGQRDLNHQKHFVLGGNDDARAEAQAKYDAMTDAEKHDCRLFTVGAPPPAKAINTSGVSGEPDPTSLPKPKEQVQPTEKIAYNEVMVARWLIVGEL